MSKKIKEIFVVGGTPEGPSIPQECIQEALGKVIAIDIITRSLIVPTEQGIKVARPGDSIIAYEDKTFDVEHKKIRSK